MLVSGSVFFLFRILLKEIMSGMCWKSYAFWKAQRLKELALKLSEACKFFRVHRCIVVGYNYAIWHYLTIWVFPEIGVPQNGWFKKEHPIKIDDLGVPLFLETPIYIYRYRYRNIWSGWTWRFLGYHPVSLLGTSRSTSDLTLTCLHSCCFVL